MESVTFRTLAVFVPSESLPQRLGVATVPITSEIRLMPPLSACCSGSWMVLVPPPASSLERYAPAGTSLPKLYSRRSFMLTRWSSKRSSSSPKIRSRGTSGETTTTITASIATRSVEFLSVRYLLVPGASWQRSGVVAGLCQGLLEKPGVFPGLEEVLGLPLHLPDALSGDSKLPGEFSEGRLILAVEAVATHQDVARPIR